ncbi:uncharacterized protein SRS1_11908 [Sporisorium reilianum f. sp. reilianum]|uniref:Uncharacterized protein n=1 Tax=Sporisorium reilianum f. sp. reilianum TaxID=72559 RepID=A0A2N8U7J1_9BASI|nr:uncharacterized protein SRS1_11908 [Sporisorium reilianum f. sp. reilianum]
MRLIRRPDRQRPWWLAVGVLAFVLLFTIVSAAPTVPEASGSTSKIQPASDGKPPPFNRAPFFDHVSSLESSQIPASGRLDTRPPSRDLTSPILEGPAANEVPVNYRSQEMGPMAKQMYGRGYAAMVAKWRRYMGQIYNSYVQRQEKLRQQREEKRIAALQPHRGEVEVYPHHQLTDEELAAARKASVIAEADERHRAATRANEAAALRRASTQEPGAAARAALEPTSNFEASPRSHRPAPFASMEGTSRTASSAGYVQLNRAPSSKWDTDMMIRQAAARVEGASVRINDALHQIPLPKVSLSELGHLRLRKRSGYPRSGASASTPPDPNVPARDQGEGSVVVSAITGQAGIHEPSRLLKRMWPFGKDKAKYKQLGSSSAGSSSEAHATTAAPLEALGQFHYPGKKIAMTLQGREERKSLHFMMLMEKGRSYQSYSWENLPADIKAALTERFTNLEQAVHGVTESEAKQLGIPIATFPDYASNAIQHPLYPQQFIDIARNRQGETVFKRPDGQYVKFSELDKHVKTYMERSSPHLSYVDEAIRAAQRAPRVRKRAVDTDDDDHQARKRELSVLHKRGDPPGTGSSAAGSSRRTASLQSETRIFPYPGQTMTITRADGPSEPYEFHFFREKAKAPHLSRSWSELPEDFKKVVRQRPELGYVPVTAESRMPVPDARTIMKIKVASQPYDSNNMYFHPSYPSENIQISRDGQGQVMFTRGDRGAVAFSQLPPHLRSYMQGLPDPSPLLREAIASSRPVPSVTYPGEHILVTKGPDGDFVHYLAPAQGRGWTYDSKKLSELPRVQAMLYEDRIKVANDVLDTDNAVFNPERSSEQIHIRNINGELEFQRQTPFLTHEFVKLGDLPDHLRHYLTTSEEAQRVMQEASSLPHVRKRAIPAGEETLLPRAGGGSIPTVTLGKGGSSGSPSDVDAPRSRWFKSLGLSPSTTPGYGIQTSQEFEYPGQGIRFSMKAGRANFWPFNGFEGDNVMLMSFDSLEPEEQRLVQESSPNFQEVLSGTVKDVQWTKAVDGVNYLTYHWPDKGPEKLVETTRNNGVFYSRQSLDGKPIGDKAFYQFSELPKHLQDFIEWDKMAKAAARPLIRKRASSEERTDTP